MTFCLKHIQIVKYYGQMQASFNSLASFTPESNQWCLLLIRLNLNTFPSHRLESNLEKLVVVQTHYESVLMVHALSIFFSSCLSFKLMTDNMFCSFLFCLGSEIGVNALTVDKKRKEKKRKKEHARKKNCMLTKCLTRAQDFCGL